jgi:hypothetical protein
LTVSSARASIGARAKEAGMAVAMILEWEGIGEAEYDKVVSAMNLGGKTAKGGYFHVAGPTETGWRIVDVWESAEIADAFFASHAAAFENARVPQPKMTTWPVHNTLTPAGPAF